MFIAIVYRLQIKIMKNLNYLSEHIPVLEPLRLTSIQNLKKKKNFKNLKLKSFI